MNMEQMQHIISEVLRDADLRSTDIPSIDLYLDQILSLVEDKRATGSELTRQDKPLTKTMVNNYSKDGLIKPVKGKKYAREHIVQMLLVYALKSSMSIGEIKRMLFGVELLDDFADSDLIACYDRYLDSKDAVRDMTRAAVDDMPTALGLDIADERDFLVFLLSLVALSSYTNGIARALIAQHYPDPELIERERREEKAREKEERRREKEEKKKDKDKDKDKSGASEAAAPSAEDDGTVVSTDESDI